MKKVIFVLSLISISFVYEMRGQVIRLNEVWVNCNIKNQNDTVFYEANEINFSFTVINNTLNKLSIGTYNPFFVDDEMRFGYFEIKADTFNLKLRSTYNNQICIPSNDSIKILASLYHDIFESELCSSLYTIDYIAKIKEDFIDKSDESEKPLNHKPNGCVKKVRDLSTTAFFEQHKCFFQMYKQIIASEIFYYPIEKDYLYKTDCDSIFPSLKVGKNHYSIILTNGDNVIEYYYVN